VIRKFTPLPFQSYFLLSRSLSPSLLLFKLRYSIFQGQPRSRRTLSITDQCTILSDCLKTSKNKPQNMSLPINAPVPSSFKAPPPHDPFYRPAAPSLHDDNLPSPPCQFLPPAFSIDLHGVPFPRNLIYLPAHPSTPIGCYRSPLSSPHIPIIFFFFSSLPAHAYTSASPLPDQFITITSKRPLPFSTRSHPRSPLNIHHPSLVGLKILVKRLLVRKVNRNIFFYSFLREFCPPQYYLSV